MAKLQDILRFTGDHQRMNNYFYLFLSLIMLIIVPPVLGTMSLQLFFVDLNQLLLDLMYSLVIISSIFIVTQSRRTLLLGSILGFLTFILYWTESRAHGNNHAHLPQMFVAFVFFAYIGLNLAVAMLGAKKVTLNTLIGASVGYLLIGVLGGQCFAMMDILTQESFGGHGIETTYDYFYFSFITLTTLGYGDIIPMSPGAKAISILISIAGQIYLTCIIALLVGKYLSNKRND